MTRRRVELSIVVPLFNEEEAVERLFSVIRTEATKLARTYEILFIDDGSRDATFDRAAQLAARYPELRVIKFRRNYGQTAAMAAGFEAAQGDVIITMDGDLQNDPADMKKLLDRMEQGFDVVSGWRKDRQDKFLTRTFPSRIANRLISLLTNVYLHDYGCSLKAYRARFVKPIRFYQDMHRFFPAIVAVVAGARVTEVAVRHYPRTTGKSKYGLSRIALVLVDLTAILMLTRFLKKPVYWFGMLATPFIVLGALLTVFSVMFYSRSTEQLTIIPAISMLVIGTAFHFILHGVLAEYILSTSEFDARRAIAVRVEDIGETAHA